MRARISASRAHLGPRAQARSDAIVLQTELAKSAEALVRVIAPDEGASGARTRRALMRSRFMPTPVEAAAAQEPAALQCDALVLLLTRVRATAEA